MPEREPHQAGLMLVRTHVNHAHWSGQPREGLREARLARAIHADERNFQSRFPGQLKRPESDSPQTVPENQRDVGPDDAL